VLPHSVMRLRMGKEAGGRRRGRAWGAVVVRLGLGWRGLRCWIRLGRMRYRLRRRIAPRGFVLSDVGVWRRIGLCFGALEPGLVGSQGCFLFFEGVGGVSVVVRGRGRDGVRRRSVLLRRVLSLVGLRLRRLIVIVDRFRVLLRGRNVAFLRYWYPIPLQTLIGYHR
jgi:hypothetical protein